MSRIKRSLVSQIKEQQEFEKQQKELKRKHRIDEKNVIVVEKSNMTNNWKCSSDISNYIDINSCFYRINNAFISADKK